MPSDVALGTFDLSDPGVLVGTARRTATPPFARCARRTSWSSSTNGSTRTARFPRGPGYWAVTRHDDVWAASRNPQLFISGRGVNIGDIPQEMNEFIGSMIAMDDPRHFRLRSIVAKGFTPEADHPGRGVRADEGDGDHRSAARAVPRGRVRLRRAGRRATPPADHLRDDGHPARATKRRSSSGPTSSSASATRVRRARSSSCWAC